MTTPHLTNAERAERYARLKRFFNNRDRLCMNLGIQVTDVSLGVATAAMTIEEKHLNGADVAQGGAIFTLADLAFGAAANSHGTLALGVNASIAFTKAATCGSSLTAHARETAVSGPLATYVVEVKNEDGETIATFQGTAYRKRERLDLSAWG
ncbi:MAG: hotdog fold thioesterase [Humidesulfovibrio sp.]|uniref:PaaI family thioesterase n=1 Tax=Humidesulfovibrio sp. TaxID=2910988 RepID=UPI002736E2A0|nr:hotdog fold thioesterase [Humidesulfovibrio sp.]MDP2848658.1 hotdog fold thioesterase [Humidesulfovibrio sp.]